MLTGYILFSFYLALAYAAIMILYFYGWRLLQVWEIPPGFTPRTTVTVVIPARNEAQNIIACLQSVLAAGYPSHLLEVLVVDDFSEDETAELVREKIETYLHTPQGPGQVQIRLLRLSDLPAPENIPAFGKKRAIQAAVAEARGELIATTDADCIVPFAWLMLLVSVYEIHRPGAIAAPVMIHGEQNLLHHFQALDVAGTMGLTGAGIRLGRQHIGNGANLAYPKTEFEAVDGFAGNAGQPSGDDLFLLQKIARRRPGSVFFLKNPEAAVRTPPAPDWWAFFQQRLRWGTKNSALPETAVRLVLATVFLFCCSILLTTILVFFHPSLWWLLVVQTGVKACHDYVLLREMCVFFRRSEWMKWFWPSFFLHILYIPVVGTASLFFRKFEWKGRVAR